MTMDEADNLFAYKHLPPHLQEVSQRFHELAMHMFFVIPDEMGAYRTKALNDLWNANNWAVAAVAEK